MPLRDALIDETDVVNASTIGNLEPGIRHLESGQGLRSLYTNVQKNVAISLAMQASSPSVYQDAHLNSCIYVN